MTRSVDNARHRPSRTAGSLWHAACTPSDVDLNWLPAGTFDRGVVGGVLLGLAFFVFVCVMRALGYIREYGLLRYLKGAFRIDHDSLGLFLVLLVLLLVVVLFFRREPGG